MSQSPCSVRNFHPLPLLIATFVFSGCVSTPVAHDNATADVALLTRQAEAWDKAIISKDRAAIAANMADDFRQIDAAANVADKASFLSGIMAPELTIHPYTVEDFDVRIYGDVALLSGRTRMSGSYAGEAFTSHYRYIDVYVRRDGRWKVASVQITRVRE